MFYENLAKEIGLPLDFLDELMALREKIGDLNDLQDKLFDPDYSGDLDNELKERAKEVEVHYYMYAFYLLFISAKKLHELYDINGIEEHIFFDSMKDIVYKLKECQTMYNISGTFVFGWFPDFYRLKRFALGRFQYDVSTYPSDDYEKFGLSIKKGDVAYGLHIPSSGPLTQEECLESYVKAFNFFGQKPLVIWCQSWLLNPHHRDFLPKESNIVQFLDNFDVISYASPQEKFGDAWRIFGNVADIEIADWPEETGLQRAYKNHVLQDGPLGEWLGVIVFDGRKIINKN